MAKGFAIIAAVDEKLGIGKGNALPWKLSGDMKHFRDITVAKPGAPRNVVIMGRKTWDSLPPKYRPLPDRINAVVTAQKEYQVPAGVERFSSFHSAVLSYCELQKDAGEVFVIGGAQLYAEAIRHSLCRKLYITHIQHSFDCEAFFPTFSSAYELVKKSPLYSENGTAFCFAEYIRSS
jgi:dihydrofolate reductase/thymidylate synthase